MEQQWEAILVIEEQDLGWETTSIPSKELALVVFEESTRGAIEVSTLSEVMGAKEELPVGDNQEELVVEDERAKLKGKRWALASEQGRLWN